MLGVCSGEQFKLKEPAVLQLSESLATRDFSAGGSLSRTGTGERMTKCDDAHVDEAESTLREAISLNYEVGLYDICEKPKFRSAELQF